MDLSRFMLTPTASAEALLEEARNELRCERLIRQDVERELEDADGEAKQWRAVVKLALKLGESAEERVEELETSVTAYAKVLDDRNGQLLRAVKANRAWKRAAKANRSVRLNLGERLVMCLDWWRAERLRAESAEAERDEVLAAVDAALEDTEYFSRAAESAEARCKALVGMLRRVEWAYDGVCPCCFRLQMYGHAYSCELVALLGEDT